MAFLTGTRGGEGKRKREILRNMDRTKFLVYDSVGEGKSRKKKRIESEIEDFQIKRGEEMPHTIKTNNKETGWPTGLVRPRKGKSSKVKIDTI